MPPSDLATGTSVGAALELLTSARAAVRRLVIVTDGYENRPPRIVSALAGYRAATGGAPSLYLVQPPGAARQLAVDLKNASIPFEVFQVDTHLLGLDAFVAVLSQEGEDLFARIAATPLPRL
jgi:hypothetical protein